MPRRRCRRTRRLAEFALLVAGAGVAAGPADEGPVTPVIDRGSFTHYLREARIGEERFVISEERIGEEGTLLRAGAELNSKIGGETGRVRVALEVLGPDPIPRRYEADIDGGEPTTIVAVLVRDRLRLNVRSPKGQEMRQFLIKEHALIIDPHLAHQYFFVSRVLRDHRIASAKLIIPQEQNEWPVTINDLGIETVDVLGTAYRLRHIRIEGNELAARHVWMKGESVAVVEIPDEEWTAVRTDLSEIAVSEKREN